MNINQNRLWGRLHELGQIGIDPHGGLTRWAFTESEMKAKDWVLQTMKNAGLSVYEDYVGNVIGIYNPLNSSKTPVLSGSHYDTVIGGGIFDGCLGLLGAIEVAETLIENRVPIQRPLYVIGYKDEEGNRFNHGMIGSKAVTGKATDHDFESKDANGISIFEAMKAHGYEPERYKECHIDPIYSSVELHIEQGKVLENNDCSVGIVEGIPYLRFYEVTFKGCSGHAGATPMNDRQDPVVMMSKWIQAITKLAQSKPYTVATIGSIQTVPGSVNVICDHVKLTLDIRSMNDANIEDCLKEMHVLEQEWEKSGISIHYVQRHLLEGVECDEKMKAQLEKILSDRKIPFMRLMSGAGHDSQNFKNVCPCSMIFVRSKDGHSHRKEEYSSFEDCSDGVNALLDMIVELCNE